MTETVGHDDDDDDGDDDNNDDDDDDDDDDYYNYEKSFRKGTFRTYSCELDLNLAREHCLLIFFS